MTTGYGFGDILNFNYNEEWSTTYSKNNNGIFKPLYNSWFYGVSFGISVLPVNYYKGRSYSTKIFRVNGEMTRTDSINKAVQSFMVGNENTGKLFIDLSKSLGIKTTDSILNAEFDR